MNVLLFANVGTDKHGYYHVGDEAMFLEWYRLYRQFLPQTKLFALVSLPSYQNLQLTEQEGLPWPNNATYARTDFFKMLLKLYIQRIFHLSFFTMEQKSFIELIRQQDLIHFTGGGNLTSECGHWLYYALLVITVAYTFDIPVILTSQTIGPFSSWIDSTLTALVLNTVKIITLRVTTDSQQKQLRAIGIRNPLVMHSLDAAYSLPKTKTPAHSILPRKKNSVRIGISLHERGKNATLLESLLISMLTALQNEHRHIELLLLPHILDAKQNWDTEFMQRITANVDPKISILSPSYTTLVQNRSEIAGLIKAYTSTCDVVISSRYHSLIFALSENIPCISLVDGEYQTMKNAEAMCCFFDDPNQYLIPIQVAFAGKRLLSMTRRLIASGANVKQELQKRNQRLQMQCVEEQQKIIDSVQLYTVQK